MKTPIEQVLTGDRPNDVHYLSITKEKWIRLTGSKDSFKVDLVEMQGHEERPIWRKANWEKTEKLILWAFNQGATGYKSLEDFVKAAKEASKTPKHKNKNS